MTAYSTFSARFSTRSRTWSNFVVKRLREVRIPPLGPRLYLGGTSSAKRAEGNCDCALLHDLMVVYSVSDVDVELGRNVIYCGEEVQDIQVSVVQTAMHIG